MKALTIAICGCLLLSSSVLAGQVSVYDEDRSAYIMADKMDCRVHKSKSGVTLGLKGGNFLFSFGPELTLGGEAKVKWEEAVQSLVVRYEELCARFNTGALSKQEYDRRLGDIDNVAKEAFEFQETKLRRVRDRAKDAFKDLDRETGRGGNDVEKTLVVIVEKVEAIKPLEEVKEERPPQEAPKAVVFEPAPPVQADLPEKIEAQVYENDFLKITVKELKRVRQHLRLTVMYENISEKNVGIRIRHKNYLVDENGKKWDLKEVIEAIDKDPGAVTDFPPRVPKVINYVYIPSGSASGQSFTAVLKHYGIAGIREFQAIFRDLPAEQ